MGLVKCFPRTRMRTSGTSIDRPSASRHSTCLRATDSPARLLIISKPPLGKLGMEGYFNELIAFPLILPANRIEIRSPVPVFSGFNQSLTPCILLMEVE